MRRCLGTDEKYSNFGHIVLDEVIEKASGTTYEKYAREHVLQPAGIVRGIPSQRVGTERQSFAWWASPFGSRPESVVYDAVESDPGISP